MEIYDCTLREGEQAQGASFTNKDRAELCRKLDEFGVDYIELGWPFVSQEIFNSFKECKNLKKAKIVAFGSTSRKDEAEADENLKAIVECGSVYACIFGKTHPEHVEKQLGLTKDANLNRIFESIKFLKDSNLIVFYDAEHYFDGFLKDKDYAIETLIQALSAGAERIILCDTNGGILPEKAREIVKESSEVLKQRGFETKLGVHFHDDSGLALANTLACLPYVEMVQGTINGIGERTGNLDFSEFLPIYIKKLGNKLNIDLKKLKEINEEAFRLSGISIPEKRAFVGDSAFAHKAGVHIDATKKGASYEHEAPEDFGNKTVILLNTLGGKSSIVHLADEFGYKLDKNNEEIKMKIEKLFSGLKEYEKAGYRIGGLKAEQFLLLDNFFGKNNEIFKIIEWKILSEMREKEENSYFAVICKINGELVEESMSVIGGPIDAAFKTLKKMLSKKYPEIEKLELLDFHVGIARARKEESAVRTEITFKDGEEFTTVGVDKNILGSSIEALEKGFRYYLKSLKDNNHKEETEK